MLGFELHSYEMSSFLNLVQVRLELTTSALLCCILPYK